MSLERAHWMARLEAELGIKANYFFMISSDFYNLFEQRSIKFVREIARLGHFVGVHLDAGLVQTEKLELKHLEHLLETHISIFKNIVGLTPCSVSYHNPTVTNALEFRGDKLGTLWNAYSLELQREYKYVSDSNGYWRFERLGEVLSSGKYERLHVLTHPEWWTKTAMMPRDRVELIAQNRVSSTMDDYDNLLLVNGRLNGRSDKRE
jgi:hypothetical protein